LYTFIIHNSVLIPSESLSNQQDSHSAVAFWAFSKQTFANCHSHFWP